MTAPKPATPILITEHFAIGEEVAVNHPEWDTGVVVSHSLGTYGVKRADGRIGGFTTSRLYSLAQAPDTGEGE